MLLLCILKPRLRPPPPPPHLVPSNRQSRNRPHHPLLEHPATPPADSTALQNSERCLTRRCPSPHPPTHRSHTPALTCQPPMPALPRSPPPHSRPAVARSARYPRATLPGLSLTKASAPNPEAAPHSPPSPPPRSPTSGTSPKSSEAARPPHRTGDAAPSRPCVPIANASACSAGSPRHRPIPMFTPARLRNHPCTQRSRRKHHIKPCPNPPPSHRTPLELFEKIITN